MARGTGYCEYYFYSIRILFNVLVPDYFIRTHRYKGVQWCTQNPRWNWNWQCRQAYVLMARAFRANVGKPNASFMWIDLWIYWWATPVIRHFKVLIWFLTAWIIVKKRKKRILLPLLKKSMFYTTTGIIILCKKKFGLIFGRSLLEMLQDWYFQSHAFGKFRKYIHLPLNSVLIHH